MSIDSFRGTTPEFLPGRFFAGKFEGWAVLESVVGGLQRRATISAEGAWNEAAQTVNSTETYQFDYGHQDTFRWPSARPLAGNRRGRSRG